MAKSKRHEFSKTVKLLIAKRAGWLCSHPSCYQYTVGSTSDGMGVTMVGTAAHICAAAPGGPRFDPEQTPEERSAASNGIWMCRDHGTAIDSGDPKYTITLLREWKTQAEKDSWRRVINKESAVGSVVTPPTESQLLDRLRTATRADLEAFHHSTKWPSTEISLTLQVDGLNDHISPSELSTALTTLDNLILVAPPGMGKTTVVFQIAKALSKSGNASPIVVHLADWSTENIDLLESVIKRPAYRGFSQDNLRAVAAKPGVVLLLDGWNELDTEARKCLTVQVRRLQAELPEINFLISTRKQTLDVPIDGTRVNLLPLRKNQQIELAKELRGEVGIKIVDQAWRTAGVRELVTIPLYLIALLKLPEGAPFPTTKEEVLRRFVSVHENDPQRAQELMDVMYGLHRRFLEGLAVTATRVLNTTISENVARKSVAEVADLLMTEGQLTEKPQPSIVLEALVNHHVLTRSGDPAGYSFQHQQFQEWYASHFVERLMLLSISDTAARKELSGNVLNQPVWEESILFACERLARGSTKEQEACAATVLSAFDVDPMLAAEMIFRANGAVWARVGRNIQERIRQWHTPGKVGRAVHFMVSSGRPEFIDLVWPLIAHENNQIHLEALRSGRRFRPSLLGSDAVKRLEGLPPKIRQSVLQEIVSNSGMDGMDLATTVAKNDPDPKVKAAVVEALAFRGGDLHIVEILGSADESFFDLLIRTGLIDDVADEHVKKQIEAARERQSKKGASPYARLQEIVYAKGNKGLGGELSDIIAKMEINKEEQFGIHLLHEGYHRYPQAIAEGILQRVRAGRTLFYGADDLLASTNLSLEDDGLLQIILSNTSRDQRAEAAASVLGPGCVGQLIDALIKAKQHIHDADVQDEEAARTRYHDLLELIKHTPGASLIVAVQARSSKVNNEKMAELAEFIARHPDTEDGRGRPFNAESRIAICSLAEDWGGRMLASGDATRQQLASIARLAIPGRAVRLLPLLKRLLDENLSRYREFRKQAEATGWRSGPARDEAHRPHTHEYQSAFQAIKDPETAALMREYLQDEHFDKEAAGVLAAQWEDVNEPNEGLRFGGTDFSRVEEKRLARAHNPTATSEEAESIFSEIERLITEGASEQQKQHAVKLGIVAVRLPHGQRDSTIQKLISFADLRSRAALLKGLILSGETIDIELVKAGIGEVYQAAKKQTWILNDGWELKDWLSLLPFTNHPTEALVIVQGLPSDHHRRDYIEGLIATFEKAPGEEVENVLFQLAEAEPTLHANHRWQEAIFNRGSISAGRRVIELVANGKVKGDDLYIIREIGGLMVRFPELREYVYALLKKGETISGLTVLARAVAESPDADGLLLLVQMGIEHKGCFLSRRTVESVVTEHVPADGSKDAYNIVPVSAKDLRKRLLAMTTDGGPKDIPARCLREIDKLRDEYGTPDAEPRHPDLESGKPWPIMSRTED